MGELFLGRAGPGIVAFVVLAIFLFLSPSDAAILIGGGAARLINLPMLLAVIVGMFPSNLRWWGVLCLLLVGSVIGHLSLSPMSDSPTSTALRMMATVGGFLVGAMLITVSHFFALAIGRIKKRT